MKPLLLFFTVAIILLNLITVKHSHAQRNTSYNLNSVPIDGYNNSALGIGALSQNYSGQNNAALGNEALFSNTTGYNNTASGINALLFNINGFNNSASGFQALYFNKSGSNNSASGTNALYSNLFGTFNTASGTSALYSNSTGSINTASGANALYGNTTGYNNTASGANALFSNVAGYNNTATGYQALFYNTSGTYNTAMGDNALFSNVGGYNNTALGDAADYSYDNTNSTFLGAKSDATTAVDNSTAVGFGALVDDNNQVRIGNTAVTSIGGQVDWTTLSDGRFKKNLKEDVPGISFINKLHPITYNLDVSAIDLKLKAQMPLPKEGAAKMVTQPQPWDDQQKSKTAKAQIKYTGFVAQEVEKAAQELGYDFSGVDAPKSKEGFYGLRYSEFVVPLVKAVQEQQNQIDEQQKQIAELKVLVTKLLNGQQSNIVNQNNVNVSGAYLEQNSPNPHSGSTLIRYHLPLSTQGAHLIITNIEGQVMKSVELNGRGDGQVNLNGELLAAGSYSYSLWVEGKQVDIK